MTPITISVPNTIWSEYFMTSLDQYYGDIIKFAHLQQKADAVFHKAKSVFTDDEAIERSRVEQARELARQEYVDKT